MKKRCHVFALCIALVCAMCEIAAGSGVEVDLSESQGLPTGIWKSHYTWPSSSGMASFRSYTTFIVEIHGDGKCKFAVSKKDYYGSGTMIERWSETSWADIAIIDDGYIVGSTSWEGYQGRTRPLANIYFYPIDAEHARMYYDRYAISETVYWRKVESFPADPLQCAIRFHANDGVGEMESIEIEVGERVKLPSNEYKMAGCVFQGWAESKTDADNGIVKFRDEAEIAIDRDMMLYAVWANPALTLVAESASWSSGSITLCCTDADTSGEKHKYTLQCFHDDVSEWVDVGDDRAIDVSPSADGKAHLTDGFFAERFDGIPPVKYRVRDKHNRSSADCVTRTKYGIFVSPGGYAPEMELEAYPSANPNYAATFGSLATGDKGKFSRVHVLTGSNAIYSKINDAFNDISGKIKTGDVCFLYFGTHGGLHPNSTSSRLALYSGYYEEEQLANHIKLLNGVDVDHPNGNDVAIVGFVHACHAKGISDTSLDDTNHGGYCQPGSWCVNSALSSANAAWITATDNPKALSYGDAFSLSLLTYGWEYGLAGEPGEPLLCKALAEYTKRHTDSFFAGLDFVDGNDKYKIEVGIVDNANILGNIYIGTCGSHAATDMPTVPVVSAVGTAVDRITVSISNMYNFDTAMFLKKRGTDSAYWEFWGMGRQYNVGQTSLDDPDVQSSGRECPYYYQVRTLNSAGVGVSTDDAYAWRVHTESHKVTFMYRLPTEYQGGSSGYYFDLPYDTLLSESGIWIRLKEQVESLNVREYTLTGWYTKPNGRGSRISETSPIRVLGAQTYYGDWTPMTQAWLDSHPITAGASNGDIATAASMTAANGCRTVGECYSLGIDPEDPDDDLKIADFEMKDGKPVITLNHAEDGSGNSFLPRVKTLGKATLSDAEEWREVPVDGDETMRFFKVEVEMP